MSDVAVGLYPAAARRFRTINIIKPMRRIPAIAAIIMIIGNQLKPFLAGGGISVTSVPTPSVAWLESNCVTWSEPALSPSCRFSVPSPCCWLSPSPPFPVPVSPPSPWDAASGAKIILQQKES